MPVQKRREFTQTQQIQIAARATRDGQKYCEECGLPAKKYHIDHKTAEGLVTDKSKKLTINDGQLLCLTCHAVKTEKDRQFIDKAKRQEARDQRVKKPGTRPIQNARKEKPAPRPVANGLTNLARRFRNA